MTHRLLFLLGLAVLPWMARAQEKISGSWHGVLDAGQVSLHMVFHLDTDEEGQDVCKMDVIEQNLKGFPVVVKYCGTDSLSLAVPLLGASYAGRLQAGLLSGNPDSSLSGGILPEHSLIVGKFHQHGYVFDLNLEPGSWEPRRPQTPKPPFDYQTEEVCFLAPDSARLCGTLTYPVGYKPGKRKKTSVVVLVSGSGQQDRDETIMSHKPFAVLADYLAEHGIASLRYDDRGKGASEGDPALTTTYTNMQDALAGINYLRQSRKFGPVGVIGHSEGGVIAFMIGAENQADFIVSMAGSAIPGDSILLTQNRMAFESMGQPDSLVDAYCAVLERVLDYRVSGQDVDSPRAVVDSLVAVCGAECLPLEARLNLSIVLGQESPWIDFFIAYDPAQAIAKVRCPVFALNGELDTQVLSSENLPVIESLLPPCPQNRVVEYRGLNHLFQHAVTGLSAEYSTIEETLSEEVLQDIADWINGLGTARR